VAGLAAGGQPEPQRYLLSHLHREHHVVAEAGAAAALVQQVADAGEDVRMVLDQPAGAVGAAGLLVGGGDEQHVAPQGFAGGVQGQEGLQVGDADALHVERPAAPDVTVADLAGKRRHLPVAGVGGHHVDVVQQHQGRLAAALEARPKVAAPGRRLSGAVGNARGLEDGGQVRHPVGFVARRVGGVDAQVIGKPFGCLLGEVGGRGGAGQQQSQQQSQRQLA
jgi:hypothetical protein